MARTRCSSPRGEPLPFGAGQHPRDDVEGDDALLGLVLAVDREGDADPAEQELRLEPAVREAFRAGGVDPALEERRSRGGWTHRTGSFH